MKNVVIGIDISKNTLDICVKSDRNIIHSSIENTVASIKKFLKQYAKDHVLLAMENTGRYNWRLYEVLPRYDFKVYVINPLHLKNSIGLTRGKNDTVDAQRICSFIEKNYRECPSWQPDSPSIQKLKVLLSERNARLKMIKTLKAQQQEYTLLKNLGMDKSLLRLNKKLVDDIQAQVKKIELSIEKLISEEAKLEQQARLVMSVPGVGKVTTWMVLAKTAGFTTIKEARKMACYSGVVPFDYQSGSALNKRPRVSHLADKAMKSTLHMAAMNAIQFNSDLGEYYRRKISEGKNKMSVLNAVRNKILHRIFAVVNRGDLYKESLDLS